MNEILRSFEKEGGAQRNSRQMEAFQECLDRLGLFDLRFSGAKFTWRGKRGGEVVKCRLDRFATDDWRVRFPASKVTHLKPSKSDHFPIIIEVCAQRVRKIRRRRRFRLKHTGFMILNVWILFIGSG